MRIVHLSEPGSGGVKRYVVDLLHGLAAGGSSAYSLLYSLQRADKTYPADIGRLRAEGIYCAELGIVPELNPWEDLCSAWRLCRVLHVARPDVLHMHSSKAGGIGRLVARLCFPSVVTIYVPHAMACYRSRFYLWVERLLAPLSDLLVAVSPSEAEDFMRWGVDCKSNVRVVRIGLPEMPLAPARPSRDEFVVAAGGRICAQKNALLFFQVAVRLVRTDPRWRFVWVGWFGDDAEAKAVKALLAEAGTSQIEVTGWVGDPERILGGADVFCMFSRYESFGYITAEVMLTGVPVVAVDGSGTRDLVRDGDTGVIVEAQVEAICRSLEECRANPARLARTTARARDFILRTHHLPGMAGDVAALYAQVESSRRFAVI